MSAHRLLHINRPVQILPVGHIFPAVDKSSEKRLIPFQAQRLIFIVKSKRCRVNLFKRHRFDIVVKHLLVTLNSLRLDFFLYDVTSSLGSGSSIDWIYCSFLLIDDVTADVIYA
ncbi:hypothetical protein F511_32360 [Dorcoceras hygrometricum]|uniref:Uncharacterized protein n=1 Tax=Dorcoceras hygrometricum TaxID=472368 RepID=A0A2Z7CN85_9LAMI|nr:hypothetical protein F511_32360 [Dorcoceras hygrometricum]